MHARERQPEDVDIPTLTDACNCLQLHIHDSYTSCLVTSENLSSEISHVHHLFSTDFQINGNVIVYYYTKSMISDDRDDCLSLILLIKHANGSFRKILCHSTKQTIPENNQTVLEINPSEDRDIFNMVTYQYQVPDDWTLR